MAIELWKVDKAGNAVRIPTPAPGEGIELAEGDAIVVNPESSVEMSTSRDGQDLRLETPDGAIVLEGFFDAPEDPDAPPSALAFYTAEGFELITPDGRFNSSSIGAVESGNADLPEALPLPEGFDPAAQPLFSTGAPDALLAALNEASGNGGQAATGDDLLLAGILDDRPAIFSATTELNADFEGRVLLVTVQRSGNLTGSDSVDFSAFAGVGDTASAGDFGFTSGSLTFAPGETEQQISIPLLADASFDEAAETFTFALSNPTTTRGSGEVEIDQGSVALTILNDSPPLAQDDAFNIDDNSALAGNLLAANGGAADASGQSDAGAARNDAGQTINVVAINGAALTASTTVTLASGARVTVGPDGTFSYDQNGQFDALPVGNSATDSFTYTIRDDLGGTSTAQVNITIQGANDAPVGVNDTASATEGVVLNVPAVSGVLANDTDAELDMLSIGASDTASAAGAVVAVGGTGGFTYDPTAAAAIEALAEGQIFVDTFSYTPFDGTANGSPATVQVTVTGVNDAVMIGGFASPPAINESQTTAPFAGVTVTDVDTIDLQTVTITLDDAAKGVFTAASLAASGFTAAGGGVYTLANVTAAAAQAAMRALQFDPTDNRVALGGNEVTVFDVQVSDGTATVSDNTTTVTATSVNDAPVIGGTVANPAIDDTATVMPFGSVTVSDADEGVGDLVDVTVTLDDGAKGVFTAGSLTASGFVDQTGGVYTLTGVAASAAQTALRALVFDPTDNRVAPNATEVTTFTLDVDDGDAAPSDNTTTVTSTSVNDAPQIGGTAGSQAVNDNATVTPFGAVTVSDADTGENDLVVTVTLDTAAKGVFTAASLTASGFVDQTGGVYRLSGVDATTAQTALRALAFDPAESRVLPGTAETTTFTLELSDGLVTTTDMTTSVDSTAVNDNPTAVADTFSVSNLSTAFVMDVIGPGGMGADLDPDLPAETLRIVSVNGTGVVNDGDSVELGGAGVSAVVTLGGGGTTLSYNAVPEFGGLAGGSTAVDTFTYTIEDSQGVQSQATVTANIVTNVPPTANPDTAGPTSEDAVLTVAQSALLSNDSDPEETPTFVGVTSPSAQGATVTVNGSNIDYDPRGAAALQGLSRSGSVDDTFDYQITDGVNSPVTGTVTVTVQGANDAPEVGGAAVGQTVDDNATLLPFSGFTITDVDVTPTADAQTVTVSLDDAAKGVFTAGSLTASGFVDQTGGVYTFSGTAAAAQVAIRQLSFAPTDGRVAPGSTETTTFTVSVNDGLASDSDGTTTVVSTSVNDAPQIAAITTTQTIDDTATANPFGSVTVSDADESGGDLVTVTVTLDDAAKGAFTAGSLTTSGFTDAGGGVYTLTGVAASAAQTALRALVFNPTDNRVAPSLTETTTFTLDVDDGDVVTSDNTTTVTSTSVNDTPIIGGTAANPAINDTATANPFSAVTVTDADESGGDLVTVTVTLDDGAKGVFTAASLTASGFVDQTGGVYTLTGVAASAAQTALRALVFDPTDNRVAPTSTEVTTFTLDVDDGDAAPSDNTTTVTSTSVNDAPQIGGTAGSQAVLDNATVTPFGAVTVSDADTGENDLVVTVTLDTEAKGVFTPASLTASGFVDQTGGVYRLSGVDATTAQTALRALAFDPAESRVLPGTAETTTFTLDVSDGLTTTTDMTTSVDSTAVNDNPTAVADTFSVSNLSTAFVMDVIGPGGMGADLDPDLPAETLRIVSVNGTGVVNDGDSVELGGAGVSAVVTLGGGGTTLSYNAVPEFGGLAGGSTAVDTFTYTIEDSQGVQSQATVTANIVTNVPPTANPDTAGPTSEDAVLTVAQSALLSNDSDPEETPTFVGVLSPSAQGATVTVNGSNIDYDPRGAAALQGLSRSGSVDDTFDYQITDGVNSPVTGTVTVTVQGANDAPEVGGAAVGQTVDDNATLLPFSGFTITDVDVTPTADAQTVTVSLDDAAKGVFTAGSLTASGFVDQTGGVYTFSGTAAAAQAAIRQLSFAPTDGRVAPGSTETTTFTVSVNDGLASDSDGTTTVVSTSVNDAPVVGAITTTQTIDDTATANPFGSVTVSDADESGGDLVTVTVTLDAAAKGVFTAASLTASGFVDQTGGVYTLTGVAASAAQTALRALVFNPTDNRVAPSLTETTTFTLDVDDGDVVTSDTTTTVTSTSANDAPQIAGFTTTQTIDDTATANPFSAVTVTDADESGGDLVTVTVTLDDGAKGVFTAGSLTASGFMDAGGGVYTLAGVAASAAQTALRALVFDPTDNRVAPNATEVTTFTLDVDDGDAAPSDNTTTVTSTSVNDAPQIGGTAGSQAVNDNATVTPFGAVTVSDADTGENDLVVTVTLDTAAKGVFTAASLTASGFVDQTGGVYRLSGVDATTAQTALRALAFDPAESRVLPGTAETTTFTLDVSDGLTTTTDMTTSVDSTAVNDNPTAVADTFSVSNLSTAFVMDVIGPGGMGADLDPDLPAETLRIVSVNGTGVVNDGDSVELGGAGVSAVVTLGGGGTTLSYNAVPEFGGLAGGSTAVDTFTYTIEDSQGVQSQATVTANIVTNVPPTANPDTAGPTSEDAVLTVAQSALLSNDSDPEETPTFVGVLSPSAQGATVTVNGSNIDYDPRGAAALQGLSRSGSVDDTFDYQITDGVNSPVTGTVTVTVQGANDAPEVGGAAVGQTVDDNATLLPFSGFTITDVDVTPTADAQMVTVSLDDAAKGVFTSVSLTASGFVDQTGGVYTFSGTAAAAQVAIRQLSFAPTDGRVAPGSTETTTFTVSVNDGLASDSDGTTTVVSTSVNDAPVVGAITTTQTIDDTATANPFGSVTVSDADESGGDLVTVTVTLDDAAKGAFTAASLTTSGFTDAGGGVYTLTGVAASAAQTALRALVFNPTDNRVAPSLTETTTFTLDVDDGDVVTSDNTTTVTSTSVNDTPIIGGTAANPAINDTALANPFGAVTVTDGDPGENDLVVTVTLDTEAKGVFTAASLTTSGFVDQTGGVYTLTGVTASAAQTALQALVFNPTDNRVAPTSTEVTTFTLEVDDGDATATDNATTVTATSVNDAPTIGGTVANPAVNDTATVAPFSTVTITDADAGENDLVVTVTLDTAAKGVFTAASLTASGFVDQTGGVYRLSGVDATAAQSAIRQLVFNPADNRVAPGATEQTTFTIAVNDGNATSTNNLTTATSTSVNDAPQVGGITTAQTIDDTATALPFGTVTLTDADEPGGDLVTVTVTLDDGAKGVFTAASLTASGFADQTGGAYTLTNVAASSAQAAIRQLVFNPTDDRVASGLTETTTFTVDVNDGTVVTSNNSTTVTSTSVNAAPTIGGTANPTVNDTATATPFSAVTIVDNDPGETDLVVTVSLDTAAKGVFTAASLTASGFVDQTGGVYRLSGVTPGVAQTAIRQLVFDPTENRVAPGTSETTTFTIAVDDGDVISSDSTTTVGALSVNDAPTIGGTVANPAVNDTATVAPFGTVTVVDDDAGENDLVVTVNLDAEAKGAFTAASLTASGFVDQTGGVYQLSGVTASAAQSAIRQLVFNPADNRVVPGSTEQTTFTIAVNDGDDTATDNTTTATSTSVNDAPQIGGTVANPAVNDTATVAPFGTVTIADADAGENDLVVTVTLDTAAKGVFTAASLTASGFVDQTGGVYQLSGVTASAAQTAIGQLLFNPTDNRVAPGSTEQTTFTIAVDDGDDTTTDNTTTATSTSVNDAPQIGGTVANPAVNDTATVAPFSGVTITDADAGETDLVVTVSLDTAAKGVFTAASLTASGFADQTGGVYQLSGVTASAAQSAIRQLVFNPANNRVAPGATEQTTFTIAVNDGNATSTNSLTTATSTSVNDAPQIGGTVANPAVNDTATVAPFSGVTIMDADAGENDLVVTVTLDTAAKGVFTAASLTASGFADQTGGVYQLSGVTATAAQSAIRQLVFNPANNRVAPGATEQTTFTIAVDDGDDITTDNTTTATSTSVNDAPQIGGTVANPAVDDTATVAPFSGVTITDADAGETDLVVTVSLDTAAKGVFTAASLTASGFVDQTGGVYRLSGVTASAAQTAIRQLLFNPADNRVAPGSTEQTTFTIAVDDGDDTTTDNTTTATSTSVNDAPTATNLTQTVMYPEDPGGSVDVANIVITENDVNQNVTATLTLNNPLTGTLTTSGAASYAPLTGVWTITGTPTAVNTALGLVAFVPAPDNDVDTTITTQIRDAGGLGPADGTITLDVTPDNDAPVITAPALVSDPSSFAVSVLDVDAGVGPIQVTLTTGGQGAVSLNPTAGLSFSFSDANGTGQGDGVLDEIMVFRGSPTAVNAALSDLSWNVSNTGFTLDVTVADLGNTGDVLTNLTDSVTLTTAINGPPDARDDAFPILENDDISGQSVFANNGSGADTDPDIGDTITVTDVRDSLGTLRTVGEQFMNPSGALVMLLATGAFSYDTNGAFDALAAGAMTTDTVGYTISDGISGSDTATVTVTITGQNDAPVLSDTTVVLNAIAEGAAGPSGTISATGGTTVSSLVALGGNVADPDTGAAAGIAITALDDTNGNWFFTTNNGGTAWTPINATSVTASNALLLAANATTGLYFQPDSGFSGNIAAAITFRAWDQTSGTSGNFANPGAGGGTTAFSALTDNASLEVTGNTSPTIVVNLDALNGGDTNGDGRADGIKINGALGSSNASLGDHAGESVALVGDVNGDGYGDILVGASNFDPQPTQDHGAVYLIYGGSNAALAGLTIGANGFDVSGLTGTNGVTLVGPNGSDLAGRRAGGGGDVNGDGFADVILSDIRIDFISPFTDAQEAYVFLGNTTAVLDARHDSGVFGGVNGFDLGDLDGSNGANLRGGVISSSAIMSVAIAGDVDGDGIDDYLVTQPGGDFDAAVPGTVYLVFGDAGGNLNAVDGVDLTTAPAGVLEFSNGPAEPSTFGQSVNRLGDINGDGLDDFIIGDTRNVADRGKAFVIFGADRSGAGSLTELAGNITNKTGGFANGADSLNGSNGGFLLTNASSTTGNAAGFDVTAIGDFNGDGFQDFAIAAPKTAAGSRVFVVFGKPAFTNLDLNNDFNDLAELNSNGFRIISTSDFSGDGVRNGNGGGIGADLGNSISGGGDVNGDGYDDLVFSEPGDGAAYVLFGTADIASLARVALTGDSTLFIDIGATGGEFGAGNPLEGAGLVLNTASNGNDMNVALGADINNDGYDDILVGTPFANPATASNLAAGQTYVVYGQDFSNGASVDNSPKTATVAGEALIGTRLSDTLSSGSVANATLRGGAGDDTLLVKGNERSVDGGGGDDILGIAQTNLALDFTSIANGRFSGIEGVDLTDGDGNDSLNLDVQDLLDLAPSSMVVSDDGMTTLTGHILRVFGDQGGSADDVSATGFSSTPADSFVVGGVTFDQYNAVGANAFLLVEQGLNTTI